VFTKFASCLTGPYETVRLPSDGVDWEVELVVVVGRHAEGVSEENAWSHVAGLTLGKTSPSALCNWPGQRRGSPWASPIPVPDPSERPSWTPDELTNPTISPR